MLVFAPFAAGAIMQLKLCQFYSLSSVNQVQIKFALRAPECKCSRNQPNSPLTSPRCSRMQGLKSNSSSILKRSLSELKSFRLPHQTNRLALVFDPLGDQVSKTMTYSSLALSKADDSSKPVPFPHFREDPSSRRTEWYILVVRECQSQDPDS